MDDLLVAAQLGAGLLEAVLICRFVYLRLAGYRWFLAFAVTDVIRNLVWRPSLFLHGWNPQQAQLVWFISTPILWAAVIAAAIECLRNVNALYRRRTRLARLLPWLLPFGVILLPFTLLVRIEIANQSSINMLLRLINAVLYLVLAGALAGQRVYLHYAGHSLSRNTAVQRTALTTLLVIEAAVRLALWFPVRWAQITELLGLQFMALLFVLWALALQQEENEPALVRHGPPTVTGKSDPGKWPR